MDTSSPAPSSVPPTGSQSNPVPQVVYLAAPPKSPWRWVRRFVALALVAVVVVIAAAPTVISNTPELRDHLIHRFMGKLDGDIVIDKFSIGWTTPLEIEGLELRPHISSQPVPGSSANQESLVKVHRVEAERPLWRMLWDRTDVGTIRIERPEMFVALGEKGQSNFEKVFKPILEREAKTPTSLKFGVRAQIVDGTIRGISNETREPWAVHGVNIAAGVRAASLSKSGKPELFVEKGTLVSQAQLNPGVCNDVLKYIAPNLAATTRARGTFSIELDEWRLPWKDFASGELSGRLTMHQVDIGPGVLTESYLRTIEATALVGDWLRAQNLPKFVSIADNSVVSFQMMPGGKIHHEGLKFSLAGWIVVQSHGDVGLDESLDLTTTVGIHPPNPEDRKLAIMRQLSSQEWPVNIRGKLGNPIIDASPLNVAWKQLLLQKVPADWLSGRSSVGGNAIRSLNEAGVLTPERTGALLSLMQSLATPPPTPAPYQVQRVDPNTPPGPTLGAADGATPNTVNPNSVNPSPLNPPQPSSLNVPPPPMPPSANAPTTVPPAIATPASPAPTGTAQPPQFSVADGVKLGLDVLGAVRAHRQQQQRPPLLPPGPFAPGTVPPQPPAPRDRADALQSPGAPPPPSDPASTLPPPRRPLLRQGLRMLLDAAAQPAPAGTPPTGDSQPPAAQPPTSKPPEPELPAPAKREP